MRGIRGQRTGWSLLIVVVPGLLGGCAWGGVSRPLAGKVGQGASTASFRPGSWLGRTELAAVGDQSLLAALRRLRPRLLEPGKPSFDAPRGELPAVYLDNVYQGGLGSLEDIPARRVWEVRRLSETEAYTRYTRRHRGGALVVTSSR